MKKMYNDGMNKRYQTKPAERKNALALFIAAIILALAAGGFAIGFNAIQVSEDNTTEFQAFVVSRETYSSPQVLIVQVETEEFEPILHLYQSRGIDLAPNIHIRAGAEINFRIRNRDVARFENGTIDYVEAVVLEVWGLIETISVEVEDGIFADQEVWAFLVMSSLESYNRQWRLPAVIAPSVFGGKALVLFIIAGASFIKAKIKASNEKEEIVNSDVNSN